MMLQVMTGVIYVLKLSLMPTSVTLYRQHAQFLIASGRGLKAQQKQFILNSAVVILV